LDWAWITDKPEVMPPGWPIAPDKRASNDGPIAAEKPTFQYDRRRDSVQVVY